MSVRKIFLYVNEESLFTWTILEWHANRVVGHEKSTLVNLGQFKDDIFFKKTEQHNIK